MIGIVISVVLGVVALFALTGFNVLRPTEKGVKETFGKYSGFVEEGLTWVMPMVQTIHRINTTERMAEIDRQEIITEDKLNASVDLVVFYKVKSDEDSVKKAFYSVNNFADQIITLGQTTARNVIGEMNFQDVNSKRNILNQKLATILKLETKSWGVEIVRVELREIVPPKDVQETMNLVIKSGNQKRAAIDFATAKETEADGLKRAKIKEAQGDREASILRADGAAQAFKKVNASFKGNAKELKKLEVTEAALKQNSKIVIAQNSKDLLKLFDINK